MMNMLGRLSEAERRARAARWRAILGPGPERGVIFQEYGVFPWLTVKENIAFGLKLHANRVPANERERDLRALPRLDGADGFRGARIQSTCRAACGSVSPSRELMRCGRNSC